jgi:hypothetical protein
LFKPTAHPPIQPNFGYKIEFAGRKIIISGDTLITDELREHSRSADLVVIDVMNYDMVEVMENAFRSAGNERNAKIFYDIRESHPDVDDIAVFATEAQVARLALTHYAPSVKEGAQMKHAYVNPIKAAGYDGEIIAGSDGSKMKGINTPGQAAFPKGMLGTRGTSCLRSAPRGGVSQPCDPGTRSEMEPTSWFPPILLSLRLGIKLH